MARFSIGDIAIAFRAADAKKDLLRVSGTEVTIVGPLRRRRMSEYGVCWCYLVTSPQHPAWLLRAKPHWLRRKEDKIRWSDCIWQPAEQPVSIELAHE